MPNSVCYLLVARDGEVRGVASRPHKVEQIKAFIDTNK